MCSIERVIVGGNIGYVGGVEEGIRVGVERRQGDCPLPFCESRAALTFGSRLAFV